MGAGRTGGLRMRYVFKLCARCRSSAGYRTGVPLKQARLYQLCFRRRYLLFDTGVLGGAEKAVEQAGWFCWRAGAACGGLKAFQRQNKRGTAFVARATLFAEKTSSSLSSLLLQPVGATWEPSGRRQNTVTPSYLLACGLARACAASSRLPTREACREGHWLDEKRQIGW